MTDEITLYQYPRAGRLESLSPFCVKVHLALMYKGLAYRVVDKKMPPGRALNPRGRFPAADVAGQRVVDSSEILEAIERHAPDPPLLPASPHDRARARILEDWADEVLYFYVVYWRWMIDSPDPQKAFKFVPWLLRPLVFHAIRRAVRKRLFHQGTGLKSKERIQVEVRETLESLSELMAGSPGAFLLGGETPTTADLSVFAQIDGLYWDALPSAVALIDEFPRVLEWYQAVNAVTRKKAEAAATAT